MPGYIDVALSGARTDELKRPLSLEQLAGGHGVTVDALLADFTPEERDALDVIFRRGRVRAQLDTVRGPDGRGATVADIQAKLYSMARLQIQSARIAREAQQAADEAHTCDSCHEVQHSTRLRNVAPGISGTVCDQCVTAITVVMAERARADKRRLGAASAWLDRQA